MTTMRRRGDDVNASDEAMMMMVQMMRLRAKNIVCRI